MPILAVYIVPPADTPLYTIGSSFMGYDIRNETKQSPLLTDAFNEKDMVSWVGRASMFGFHATLGDALEFPESSIEEIKTRLAWIASRTAPFTLTNGRIREFSRAISVTFDSPDDSISHLHYLIVTMINILYCSSPFFEPYMDTYPKDERYHVIRYGVPHARILDNFSLHFSMATHIPNQAIWGKVRSALIEKTGLFQKEEHRTLLVDEIHLIQQHKDRFFRIVQSFPLTG